MAQSRHEFVYTDEKKKPNLFRFGMKNKQLYSELEALTKQSHVSSLYICCVVHDHTNKCTSYVWSTEYITLSQKSVPVSHHALIFRYTAQEIIEFIEEYNPPA